MMVWFMTGLTFLAALAHFRCESDRGSGFKNRIKSPGPGGGVGVGVACSGAQCAA